jgi:rod shape-determining protein MreD
LLACLVVHLGLHAGNVEGSVGAAGVGYVLDLLAGGPKGLMTFLAVLLFVLVRGVAAAVDVRGRAAFALLSGAGALALSLGAMILTRYTASPESAPGATLLGRMLIEAVLTGALAPVVHAGLRRVDGLFRREEHGLLR